MEKELRNAPGDTPVIQEQTIIAETKDTPRCMMHGNLNGLYYYYLEPSLYATIVSGGGIPGAPVDNTSILGTTEAIANICIAPFVNLTSDDLTKLAYDTERYGMIDEKPGKPYVFRIRTSKAPKPLNLIEYDLYPPLMGSGVGATKPASWQNESKLFDFPYRTILFASNVFDQIEVIPHLLTKARTTSNTGKVLLTSVTPVNPGGNFYVGVEGYKGDSLLFSERQYATASMDLPNTSSAYSNYMSTQKAQTAVNLNSKLISSLAAPIAGAAGGFAMGGPGGAAVGLVGGLARGAYSGATAMAEHMAMKQDLISTPNALKSAGGDISTRLGYLNEAVVMAGEMVITDEYREMLGKYFARYGYKQNKTMNVSLTNRYHYNYVKTVEANVKGTGVPKKHLATIKAILDKGACFWHVDRSGVTIGDYSKDNAEV